MLITLMSSIMTTPTLNSGFTGQHRFGRPMPGSRLRGCVLLCCLWLSACANPLLRQASQDCNPEAYQLFPQVLQSQRVTEPVVVQVPDGSQHCITETVRQGDRTTAFTRCVPNYTMQTRWMERWVNVDLNARERNIWHERCVQQLCIQRVGNTACEAPTGAAVGSPAGTTGTTVTPGVTPADLPTR